MTSFFVSAVTAKPLRISDHIGLMPAETQLRRVSVKFNGLNLRRLMTRAGNGVSGAGRMDRSTNDFSPYGRSCRNQPNHAFTSPHSSKLWNLQAGNAGTSGSLQLERVP